MVGLNHQPAINQPKLPTVPGDLRPSSPQRFWALRGWRVGVGAAPQKPSAAVRGLHNLTWQWEIRHVAPVCIYIYIYMCVYIYKYEYQKYNNM